MKQKLKSCIDCKKPSLIFSKGRCTTCAKIFSFFKNKNVPQKGKSVLKRSRISSMSNKMKKELVEYSKLRKEYLIEYPNCDVCGRPAIEVHHMAGRGKRLLWRNFFLSVCRNCHNWIHNNPTEAEAKGFWIPPSKRKNLRK